MEVSNSDTHNKICEIKARENATHGYEWALKIEGSDGWKAGFKTNELPTIDLNALIESDISDRALIMLLVKEE